MATITVRELRYDFPRVEALLRQGEEIQITKRGKPLARLLPQRPGYLPLPNFAAEIKEIYGDLVFDVSGADLISLERDHWWAHISIEVSSSRSTAMTTIT